MRQGDRRAGRALVKDEEKKTDLVECSRCGRMTWIGKFCVCTEQEHVDGWNGKSGLIKTPGE